MGNPKHRQGVLKGLRGHDHGTACYDRGEETAKFTSGDDSSDNIMEMDWRRGELRGLEVALRGGSAGSEGKHTLSLTRNRNTVARSLVPLCIPTAVDGSSGFSHSHKHLVGIVIFRLL